MPEKTGANVCSYYSLCYALLIAVLQTKYSAFNVLFTSG